MQELPPPSKCVAATAYSPFRDEIAYMDHLQIPTTGLQLCTIDYNTPRFCHVTDQDFEHVTVVDHIRMNLSYAIYGSRPFHPRSEIPYLSQVHVVAGGSEVEHTGGARSKDVPRGVAEDGSTGVGVPACGAIAQDSASLDDWMRLSASSSQGTMLSTSLKSIIQKHSNIWHNDFVSTLDLFKKGMIDLHAKRTSDIISNISKLLADSNAATDNADVGANPPNTKVPPDDVDVAGLRKETSGGTDSVPSSPSMSTFILSCRSESPAPVEGCDAPSFSLFNGSDPEFISTQDLDNPKFCDVSEVLLTSPLDILTEPSSEDALVVDAMISSALPQSPMAARTPSPAAVSPTATRTPPTPLSPTTTKTSTPVVLSLSLVAVRAPSPAKCSPCASSLPPPGAASNGPSSHEKKNRKKRAWKGIVDDVEVKKFKNSADVDDVYTRYVLDSMPNRTRKATSILEARRISCLT